MHRIVKGVLAVVVGTVFVVGVPGCKDEGKPNSELQVPDVKPGGHGSKEALKKK